MSFNIKVKVHKLSEFGGDNHLIMLIATARLHTNESVCVYIYIYIYVCVCFFLHNMMSMNPDS